MKALALVLLLALPSWAQQRAVLEVQRGSLELVTGETVLVVGGAYVDGNSLLANGKELAALRAENATLKAAPSAPPASLVIVAAVALLLGVAGGVGLALRFR